MTLALAMLALSSALALAESLPDPAVTPRAINPAVTQANIDETICRRGWTHTIRPPKEYTTTLKRKQLSSGPLLRAARSPQGLRGGSPAWNVLGEPVVAPMGKRTVTQR
jgi:hypothetical protein